MEFLSHPQEGGPASVLYVCMLNAVHSPQLSDHGHMLNDLTKHSILPTYSTFLRRGQV